MDTLLLVEDSEDDVLFMKRAFKTAGVTQLLQIASDGQVAIDYLSGKGAYADRQAYPLPVLILLDLKLPVRDGHEVLAWIREKKKFKKLPVIVLTTSNEQVDVEKAYDLGANSYLVKPSGPAELLTMVKALKEYWLGMNVFAPSVR